jgi:hypothetical protein
VAIFEIEKTDGKIWTFEFDEELNKWRLINPEGEVEKLIEPEDMPSAMDEVNSM